MVTKQEVIGEVHKMLQEQGFEVEMLEKWPAKRTYYRVDGEALPNLPADPWSMKRYLARGLLLQAPGCGPPPPESELSNGPVLNVQQPRITKAGSKVRRRG